MTLGGEAAMAQTQPGASYADDLATQASSGGRLEFAAGQILAMSGGPLNHAMILASITAELHAALRDGPCRALSSDARVRGSDDTFDGFPDVTVVCGAVETLDEDPDGLWNPTLLVEGLSPCTEAWDRGGTFAHHRPIESLQEVVFVRQDARAVEVHRRNAVGRLERYDVRGHEAVEFSSLDVSLPMEAWHAGVVGSA